MNVNVNNTGDQGVELNSENAVHYHYNKFPPRNLDYGQVVEPLIKATDAVARYDQMLKNMHAKYC